LFSDANWPNTLCRCFSLFTGRIIPIDGPMRITSCWRKVTPFLFDPGGLEQWQFDPFYDKWEKGRFYRTQKTVIRERISSGWSVWADRSGNENRGFERADRGASGFQNDEIPRWTNVAITEFQQLRTAQICKWCVWWQIEICWTDYDMRIIVTRRKGIRHIA
jgi:hypothetical protein